MNDFVRRAVEIAEQNELSDFKMKLEGICPPENAPYLKVAIISALNRLPNMILGEDVLADRLIVSNQEPLCITFDGSDDETLNTIHVNSRKWSDVPLRFYVILWDKAFHADGTPSALLESMDVMVFGMDAATAFRRSMMECIEKTQFWDALIVIEELEKIPETEMDEFIRICMQRTQNVRMRDDQLVLWHRQETEIAHAQISWKILSGWENGDVSVQNLQSFREERSEKRTREFVARQMSAALRTKIGEIRKMMKDEREKLQANRERRTLIRQIEQELSLWEDRFMQSLEADMEQLLDGIRVQSSQQLTAVPLSQKQIDGVEEAIRNAWRRFVEVQYDELEISLLDKLQEISIKYNVSRGTDAIPVSRTTSKTELCMPRSFWYNPALLVGIGAAMYLCAGFTITLVLAFPMLKIKQMIDKKGILEKIDAANAHISEEMKCAFRKDLLACKENALAAMQNRYPTDSNLETIKHLTDTMNGLCELLEVYDREWK